MNQYNFNKNENVPLISILIPVYNRENLIIETLLSATDQTYKNTEIVVVDNNSTDKTFKLIYDFAKNHKKIKLYRNDKNIGPVKNWLKCFEKAKGEYGKILFSDDLMESDCLEQTLPYLKDNNVGFAFSSARVGPTIETSRVWYNWQNKSGIYPVNSFIYDALFGKSLPASPGAALFRMKDLKENLITDIPSPTYHDFELHGAGPDLFLYLFSCTNYSHVAFITKPLVFFRVHNDSITIKNLAMVRERYFQAKLYYVDLISHRQWMLNLLLYLWIVNILEKKFLKFSSFTRKYYYKKKSFTFTQWLNAFYFLIISFFKMMIDLIIKYKQL